MSGGGSSGGAAREPFRSDSAPSSQGCHGDRISRGQERRSHDRRRHRGEHECPEAEARVAPRGNRSDLTPHLPPRVVTAIGFLGDKNVALMIGAVIAVSTNVRRRKLGWRRAGTVLGAPLEMAAMIILIISAGSAYGESIKGAGLGEAVRAAAAGH